MSITINIKYIGQDLIELKVDASNGCFKGETTLYTSHYSLTSFADTIESFPASADDNREFTLGNFNSSYGGGGAKFNFKFYQKILYINFDENSDNCDSIFYFN